MHLRVNKKFWFSLGTAVAIACGGAYSQQRAQTAAPEEESEVREDAVPPDVVGSAVIAVEKLGNEVVHGRYQAAIERMNPAWKERTAARMGGMEALEKQLAGVAAEMMRQGISMISFKPQGQPRVLQVAPTKKTVTENGSPAERLVYSKWLVMVPTVTRFRIIREGNPKPVVIESTGFQVAISDKGQNNWTFIDGAGLKPADLRGLFITLPQDIELPPVGKREVR